jgi:hypothetical protein
MVIVSSSAGKDCFSLLMSVKSKAARGVCPARTRLRVAQKPDPWNLTQRYCRREARFYLKSLFRFGERGFSNMLKVAGINSDLKSNKRSRAWPLS